jgi:ubiquitin C-terminal hydrolase
LQCLAHTDPIRKYFLSGEYQKHLNRNNPLGTGGELTVQFAQLLAEMWGTQGTSSYANGYNSHFTNTNPVVYPRNFKYTLGRHAEQFVGYDQHDSQELATYLLDALHEDTNRVTQKPYVEKAEQEVDETDEEAAQKAWALHLKRDNSTVLECFMGQIKSRVQCCKPDCGRVSTTFDPSMYLSVPIPGSSERSLRVIFVSLDPSMRPQEVHVKLDKSSKVSDLLIEFIAQLKTLRLLGPNETIPLEDLCVVDVWQGDVYHYYTEDELIDKIRENDVTFIYQLHPLADIQSREEEIAKKECVDDEKSLGLGDRPTPKRFKLDKYTIHELNRHHKWAAVFEQYLKHPFGFTRAFNPNLGTTDERVKYFKTTSSFVHLCYSTVEAGQKRARDSHYEVPVSVSETLVAGLIDRSDASHYFKDVCNRFDIAILEFCLGKMRSEILNLEGRKRGVFRDGLLQRIRLRTNSGHHAASVHERALFIVAPLILRVSSDTTVYKLRLLLAKRLSRSLKTGRITPAAASGESTSEYAVALRDSMESIDTRYSGLEGQTILRQIPFSYERKTNVSSRSSAFEPLGGLRGNHRGSPAPLASQSDPAEKRLLAGIVDEQGTVFLDWPEDLETRAFDSAEFATIEKPLNPDEIQTAAESTPSDSKDLTVLDCIERYCQIEQLEESDQWYCSRCKEHVRAWKQFHLYRSSPILIIHLKRFQYSASTHRRDKIGIFVDFPLQGLDLTEHVKNWTDGEKPIYDCYGVCNHYGGLGGGHYTAHCLNDDGVWCYYDDSRITTNVDPKDVVSPAAYVLFYRRQDVQVGEDYPISLYPTSAQIPVIIQDPLDTPVYQQDEVSSSNAAMVDEGDMDLDNISDICRTSPVGSIDGGRDQCLEHEYESPGTLDGHLPLQ